MILTINTADRYNFEIGIYKNELEIFKFETANQSDDLLPAIDQTLKNNKLTLKDIDQILVNIGPGSYTGVRVGVTVANALGWSLNIPVIGFKEGELDKVLIVAKNSPTKNFSKSVLPFYN